MNMATTPVTPATTPPTYKINVSIIGAVSAGKSTLLNSLFVSEYSEMKIKRTTMLPQVYHESDRPVPDHSPSAIKEANRLKNEELIKKTEQGTRLTSEDIHEMEYTVPRVHNFVKLRDGVTLSIYDVPGLNDSRTKTAYYEYLTDNFHKFDIVVFLVDVTTAFNTMDEIHILDLILRNMHRNKERYGIETHLIVLVNKCDDMYLDNNELKLDPELSKMFEQAQITIQTKIREAGLTARWYILPISCENSFIYRIYKRYPGVELDIKYTNKVGCIEFGRARWNTLNDTLKRTELQTLFEKDDHDIRMELTGFNRFRCTMYELLSERGQYAYIMNRMRYHLHETVGLFDRAGGDFGHMAEYIGWLHECNGRIREVNEFYYSKYTSDVSDRVVAEVMKLVTDFNNFVLKKYANGIPKNEVAYQRYMDLKRGYDEVYRRFPLVWSMDRTLKETSERIAEKIDRYHVNRLAKLTDLDDILKVIDRLVDHNSTEWRRHLLRSVPSRLMTEDLMELDSVAVLSRINSLRDKYDLETDEVVSLLLTTLYAFYRREIKKVSRTLTEYDMHRVLSLLEVSRFWENLVVGSTMRYHREVFMCRNLLRGFAMGVHVYEFQNDNGTSLDRLHETHENHYPMTVESYLLTLLRNRYPLEVSTYDDLIRRQRPTAGQVSGEYDLLGILESGPATGPASGPGPAPTISDCS